MKFGVVNKSTIVNIFVLHTLQRNITRLAVITRKTNIKLGILKGGLKKSRQFEANVVMEPQKTKFSRHHVCILGIFNKISPRHSSREH